MFFGKLPHNLESTQPVKDLRKTCEPHDYPHALLLHLRFGMASGRSEESDGVLPRAQVLGLHEGSRRVATRLVDALVGCGLWETDGKFIVDVTWTKRYRTHAQVSARREQVRQAVAALRERAQRVPAPPPPGDADVPPGDMPGGDPHVVGRQGGTVVGRHVRSASNEQFQQLSEECNLITQCTDTDKNSTPPAQPSQITQVIEHPTPPAAAAKATALPVRSKLASEELDSLDAVQQALSNAGTTLGIRRAKEAEAVKVVLAEGPITPTELAEAVERGRADNGGKQPSPVQVMVRIGWIRAEVAEQRARSMPCKAVSLPEGRSRERVDYAERVLARQIAAGIGSD